MKLNNTDRATLAGLYLAKFDKEALRALGFKGMWHAFNVIGYSLEAGPASIKNYRDEFDRLFPDNPRKGWQRPLKTRSQKIYMTFGGLDFLPFTDLIKSLLIRNYDQEKSIAKIIKPDFTESVAKRLATGLAAESYFKEKYSSIAEFHEYSLTDVSLCACGFDFKLARQSNFYCVEVKGLGSNTGAISMTEKEFEVSGRIQNRYCLFVVRNFLKTPTHSLFFNPRNSLRFIPTTRQIISYTSHI
jgi:hypothetical protein